MSHASSSSLKEKEKEIQKKRNIKSRKIDKRERKMLVSKHSITIWQTGGIAHKLKLRLFYKFALPSTEFIHSMYLQVNPTDFISWCKLCLILL